MTRLVGRRPANERYVTACQADQRTLAEVDKSCGIGVGKVGERETKGGRVLSAFPLIAPAVLAFASTALRVAIIRLPAEPG